MINPQWLELPMSNIFYDPKDVRAIEDRLYAGYSSADGISKFYSYCCHFFLNQIRID